MCAYCSPQSNHVKYRTFYSGPCRRFSNELSMLPFHQTEAARTKRTAANRQTDRVCGLALLFADACLTYSRTTGLLRLLERYCICFSAGVRLSLGTANKQRKHFYLS